MSPAGLIHPTCHFSSCSVPNTHYRQTGGIRGAYMARYINTSAEESQRFASQPCLREQLCSRTTTAQIHKAAPSLPRWHHDIRGQNWQQLGPADLPLGQGSGTLGSDGGQEGSAMAGQQSRLGLHSWRSWGTLVLYQSLCSYEEGRKVLLAKSFPEPPPIPTITSSLGSASSRINVKPFPPKGKQFHSAAL